MLTRAQIDAVFQVIFSRPPREADHLVLEALGGADAEALAEYIWDHLLGEPETPSLEVVTATVEAILESM